MALVSTPGEKGTHDAAALQHYPHVPYKSPGSQTRRTPQNCFRLASPTIRRSTKLLTQRRELGAERVPIDNNLYKFEYVLHRLTGPPPTWSEWPGVRLSGGSPAQSPDMMSSPATSLPLVLLASLLSRYFAPGSHTSEAVGIAH